ncbi:unnamed protein product [Coregonus sp. 'balchen']|nr:unnamed protein product [Coregonus sp. 'balchen']
MFATIFNCTLASDVKAVLVEHHKLTFLKLAKASSYLRDPDCSGCLTAALEVATGRKATVIDKPSPFMFECISSQFRVDPAQCLMVGDRLETDMLWPRYHASLKGTVPLR